MPRLVIVSVCLWLASLSSSSTTGMAAAYSASSFVARKPLPSRNRKCSHPKSSNNNNLLITMRDRSASYWFTVGDTVRVVADDVEKAGFNLHHRVGRVVQTWEKCDVDPTCCCAEQVDLNMAVRVEFNGTESDPSVAGTSFLHYFGEIELIQVKEEEGESSEQPGKGEATTVLFTWNRWHPFSSFSVSSSRRHSLFSQNHADDADDRDTSLPFDGMSCSAFKMDHLQSASHTKRGIFSYEPPATGEIPLKQETTEPVEEAVTDESLLPFDGMSCTAFKMNHLQSASQKPRGIFSYADTLNDL